MRLRILGSVQIETGADEWLSPPSAAHRRILAILAVRRGSVVSVESIAELLHSSPGAVRTSISRLRRFAKPGTLVTESDGYTLGVETDAARFEQYLESARHSERDEAIGLRRLALDLFPREALTEFADEPWAMGEATRLNEQRSSTVEDLAEALLSSGRWAEATPLLQGHISDHPFRDRPRGLLMKSLAFDGRQTEALRTYQDYRALLANEVGCDPSAALQAVEQAIATDQLRSPEPIATTATGGLAPAARAVGPESASNTLVPPPSGTVTFLFTDIEGSTALWESAPDSMNQALAIHDEIVRRGADGHDGYVFSAAGDGFAVAFGDADQAVAAAIAMQRDLGSEAWPDGAAIAVRMGLHVGVAEERDRSYFGPVLNQASRLMGAAKGGQVLVSARAAALLDPQGRFDLIDLGTHRLRGLTQPMHAFGLTSSGLAWLDIELSSSKVRGGNIDPPTNTFIGRDDELQRLADAVQAHRLLTLRGPGGVGKTRLAVEVAATTNEAFADGTWLCELATARDRESVGQTVIAGLGLPTSDAVDPFDNIVTSLRGQSMLIILDNCEQVAEPAGELADRIVRACPDVSVLATSRQVLGSTSEQLWTIDPLGANTAAVALFESRARAADATFDPDRERQHVERICVALDGLPLAIELAAARLRSMTAADVANRLSDRFRLLKGGPAGHHATLLATAEWSYNLLSESEQILFTRLTAFAGGFDTDAATAVAPDDWDEFDVIEVLGLLADKSLISIDRHKSLVSRYRILETMREFGRSKLDEADFHALRDGHMHHYATVSTRAGNMATGEAWPEALSLFELEWVNIEAAARWAAERNDFEVASQIFRSVTYYAFTRSIAGPATWAKRAVEAASAVGAQADAATLTLASLGPLLHGPVDDVLALCAQALHAPGLAEDHWTAQYFSVIGVSLTGGITEAYERLSQQLIEPPVSPLHESMTLAARAVAGLMCRRMDPSDAERAIADSYGVLGDLRNDSVVAFVMYHESLVASLSGDPIRTRRITQDVVDVAARSGLHRIQSHALITLLLGAEEDTMRGALAAFDEAEQHGAWLTAFSALEAVAISFAENDRCESAAPLLQFLDANQHYSPAMEGRRFRAGKAVSAGHHNEPTVTSDDQLSRDVIFDLARRDVMHRLVELNAQS